MSPHSLWSAAMVSSLVVQASIVGCSSSSSGGPSGAGDDAGGAEASATAEGGSAMEGGTVTEAGSVTDEGGGGDAVVSCEPSVLPPADAGGACNACLKASCAAELAACASDCVCGPIVACLELSNLDNYQGCNGLPAIESNEAQLTNLDSCAANPAKCGGPCFANEAGAD